MYTTKFVRDLNAKVEQWETAGEATWGVALRMEAMIHPLAEHPRLSSESIPEAENQLRSHLRCPRFRYKHAPEFRDLGAESGHHNAFSAI